MSPASFRAMRFPQPAGYSNAAWVEPRTVLANFGMQLSGMGAVISLPISGWKMTRTRLSGTDWEEHPESEMLEITLSW